MQDEEGRSLPRSCADTDDGNVIPGRRRSRHNDAILCTFVLGLLALVPFLSSLTQHRRGTRSKRSKAGTDNLMGGTVVFQNEPDGGNADHQKRPWEGFPDGQDGMDGGGERALLSSEEVAGAILADGDPRCFLDEEGRSWCLPTVFFLGVSKCGTTSLSNWLAEHPRARFVPPKEGNSDREAHIFDYSPKLWHATKPSIVRQKLAAEAAPMDTVMDFTPHYSLVAEAPLRISDFFGEGSLKDRGLRFLVLLREPVGRTISSWEYKSAPAESEAISEIGTERQEKLQIEEMLSANATIFADGILELSSGRLMMTNGTTFTKPEERKLRSVERRSLEEVMAEGMERVSTLMQCVEHAQETGLFGRESEVTFCRATKGKKQCEGHPPCEICNTHTEPWCNPREYLEEVMFNAHVGKSMYAMQLRRWFNVFGRKNFKVLFTDDMAANPIDTLKDVFQFLGMDMLDLKGEKGLRNLGEWEGVVGARYNTADKDKKKHLDSQVTPALRQSMRDFFAPHNKDLEELLGVRLPDSWNY